MQSRLLFALLFSFAAACGGKEATVDRSGQSGSAQTAGKGDPAKTANGSSQGSAPSGSTTPAPDCTYSYQSGSGGGGGPTGEYSCLTEHHYECTAGEKSVSCECTGKGGTWSGGTCTCSDTGVAFAYDCSKACSPLPDEVFAKCNLPVPPPEPAGTPGGSTSSSSGGP